MKDVDRWFILIGLLYGAFGFSFGIWVGINERFDQAHLHAHINLIGWASMVLFGLLYRTLFPALAEPIGGGAFRSLQSRGDHISRRHSARASASDCGAGGWRLAARAGGDTHLPRQLLPECVQQAGRWGLSGASAAMRRAQCQSAPRAWPAPPRQHYQARVR